MTNQLSGYVTSFFVHTLFVVIVFLMGASLPFKNKPLSIDFRIDSISGTVVEKPKPRQEKAVKKNSPPLMQRTIPDLPPQKVVRAIPQKPFVIPEKLEPIKEKEPVAEEPLEEIEEIAEAEPVDREAQGVNEISEEEYLQQVRTQFLRSHFQYIRENIQNKVVYPRIARKMGWQGKVVVRFVVCEDGRVINVEIIESSGFSVLDDNAVKSVREAAPFPKPPVRTELIIPIRFGLV